MVDYTPCLTDCCDGLCGDCKPNLEAGTYVGGQQLPYIGASDVLLHQGLQSYYGTNIYGYSKFDCITDPIDDCCLCCVDNQLLNTTMDTYGPIEADCHVDLITQAGQSVSINPYDGTQSGTGMWVWCGVNEDNLPASCPTNVVSS